MFSLSTHISTSAKEIGMDDFYLNRMLFEWLGDRFLSLRFLATSSCGLNKDYPCSGCLEPSDA